MLHTYGNQLCSESNMCENSIGREYVQVANWQVAKCPVTFKSHQIIIVLISTVIQLIGNHFSPVKKNESEIEMFVYFFFVAIDQSSHTVIIFILIIFFFCNEYK